MSNHSTPKAGSPQERNWPGDYLGENGNYENVCIHCGQSFIGYKRRVVCRVCASLPLALKETPCDCEGLWNDPELRMGPVSSESYIKTSHLSNCPYSRSIPTADFKELLDKLESERGLVAKVIHDERWRASRKALEDYVAGLKVEIAELEEGGRAYQAENESLRAELASLRDSQLTAEEAQQMLDAPIPLWGSTINKLNRIAASPPPEEPMGVDK